MKQLENIKKFFNDSIFGYEQYENILYIYKKQSTQNIFDKNGNLISSKYFEKYTFDEYGRVVLEEYSNGFKKESKYDENGNLIYWKCHPEYYTEFKYDKNNKLQTCKTVYTNKKYYVKK